MHLRSARRDAHWHPFTGLIEHEGIWESYAFHALPFVSDPPMMEGRSVATIIHHELTHHASARTTRLGFAYSAEAARLLRAFRDGGELTLTSPAKLLLGTFLPILEGLAVYAELDADEEPGDVIIPNPIPLHAQMMELAWHRSSGDILRIAREQQIYETPHQADGLLRFLFADANSPETGVYLIGYLWVKAAVAHIRRINAALARPTIVLPFLIKLFCDHPVIVDVWKGEAGETEIISRLRESILSLDQTALARIEKALANKEELGTFELWDLHGFLADESLESPRLDDESLRPFFTGGEPDELETQLRLGASIHFPSRVAGVIAEVKRRDRDLELEIETDSGKRVQATFLSVLALWRVYHELPHYRPLIEKHAATAAGLEDAIWGLMEEWKGQRITLARYWGISHPPLPGIVVWHEDGRMVHLPYEPQWYEFEDHIELTKYGLGISIDEKQRFAKALSKTPIVTSLARQSANVLLSHLVSNERARTNIIYKRLGGALGAAARAELESWVAFPLFPTATWRLGEPACLELTKIFDMPAFPSLHSDFTFSELLPPLDQHRSSQEPKMSDKPIENHSALDAELDHAGVTEDIRKLIRDHVSEPGTSEAELVVKRIVVTGGKQPGTRKVFSARLQNWVLNWKTLLFDAVPSIAGGLGSSSKIGIVVGLLKGLKALVEGALVELEEREAALVMLFWSDENPVLSKDVALSKSGLTSAEFEKALDGLLALGIIDIEDDSRIIKTEQILFV